MTSPASASAIPQLAARGAVGFAGLAFLSMLAVHAAQPGLEIGTSMISQYSVGEPMGWLMNLSFGSFAAASLALLVALTGVTKSTLGRIGLFFLMLAAIGTASGGLFNMDPVTTDQSQMSFSGQMHGLAFMVGVPGELLAVLLLSLALRKKPGWNGTLLLALAAVVWISLAVMAYSLINWMSAGAQGPSIFGWPNRSFMIGYALWMIAAAWPLARR
jgi:hypothetical protein